MRHPLFAGIQYSSQCFCGDSYGRYGQLPDRSCKRIRTADGYGYVGGAWMNAVYSTRYIGCYEDSADFEISSKLDGSPPLGYRTVCELAQPLTTMRYCAILLNAFAPPLLQRWKKRRHLSVTCLVPKEVAIVVVFRKLAYSRQAFVLGTSAIWLQMRLSFGWPTIH